MVAEMPIPIGFRSHRFTRQTPHATQAKPIQIDTVTGSFKTNPAKITPKSGAMKVKAARRFTVCL
jgi:hypothetical protein